MVSVLLLYCDYCFLFVCLSVLLTPSGNVPVCPGGSGSLKCMTTVGSLVWTSNSINSLLNSEQDPVMVGNLTLSVESVVANGTTISVTSNATIDNFFSNGLMVECSETTTDNSSTATFVFTAGKL